jgi:hypothetical protein
MELQTWELQKARDSTRGAGKNYRIERIKASIRKWDNVLSRLSDEDGKPTIRLGSVPS